MTKYVIDLADRPGALASYVDAVNRRDGEMRRTYGGDPHNGASEARRKLADSLRHAEAYAAPNNQDDWADQLAAANTETAAAREELASLRIANANLLSANQSLQESWTHENRRAEELLAELRDANARKNELARERATLVNRLHTANARATRLQDVSDKLRRHLVHAAAMLRSIKSDTTTQVLAMDQCLADVNGTSEAPE
jgi:chromosome segregation ATPase